jgi:peptide/nickel transport system ATP-binding protein
MTGGAATDVPILDLIEVSHDFEVGRGMMRRGKLRAVDGVSLRLAKGDVLGIVGESGSGKTTLSRIMLGLLAPTSGQVLLDGLPLARHDRRAIARRVQFVFQDPYSSLNPLHKIARIIRQPLMVHELGDAASRERAVDAMLDVVGLPKRLRDAYPSQLSGGQRQRVVIARALILRPDLLICDEPTSALDVSVQTQILNLLIDLRREFGLTYVLISHNLAVIEHMATEVAVMYLGRIVEYTGADQLFGEARHPYTRVLLRSTMTIAPGAGIPDVRLTGALPDPTALPSGCRFHPRCPEVLPVCAGATPPKVKTDLGFAECHLLVPPARDQPQDRPQDQSSARETQR